MKVRPSVVIIENDCVLLMRYRYGQTDVYNLPGGNVDKGETLTQTIIRELQEELGITITVEKMILLGEVLLPEPQKDVLHGVFLAKIMEGKPVLNPTETSALEVVWKPIHTLKDIAMYPNVGAELEKFLLENTGFQYVEKINQVWFVWLYKYQIFAKIMYNNARQNRATFAAVLRLMFYLFLPLNLFQILHFLISEKTINVFKML